MTKDDKVFARAKVRLQDELDMIVSELHDMGFTDDGGVEVSLDDGFADAAHATSERSRVLSIGEGLQERMASVKKALLKVEEGTYGACSNCGNKINPERLEAIPSSTLCIDCAQRG